AERQQHTTQTRSVIKARETKPEITAALVAATGVRPGATRVAMIAASTVPRPAGGMCAEPASLAVIYASVTPARVVSLSPALIHGIAPLTAHTQAHNATMSKRRWP